MQRHQLPFVTSPLRLMLQVRALAVLVWLSLLSCPALAQIIDTPPPAFPVFPVNDGQYLNLHAFGTTNANTTVRVELLIAPVGGGAIATPGQLEPDVIVSGGSKRTRGDRDSSPASSPTAAEPWLHRGRWTCRIPTMSSYASTRPRVLASRSG